MTFYVYFLEGSAGDDEAVPEIEIDIPPGNRCIPETR